MITLRMMIDSDESSQWTDDQVNAYVDAFKTNVVNGHLLLNFVNEDRLTNDLGVGIFAHRLIILKWIDDMRISALYFAILFVINKKTKKEICEWGYSNKFNVPFGRIPYPCQFTPSLWRSESHVNARKSAMNHLNLPYHGSLHPPRIQINFLSINFFINLFLETHFLKSFPNIMIK